MTIFDTIIKAWKSRTNDNWDTQQREMKRREDSLISWENFGNGMMRDFQTGEREALEALEALADGEQTPETPIQVAEWRGEARAFRKMQATGELRGKTLGIELRMPQ